MRKPGYLLVGVAAAMLLLSGGALVGPAHPPTGGGASSGDVVLRVLGSTVRVGQDLTAYSPEDAARIADAQTQGKKREVRLYADRGAQDVVLRLKAELLARGLVIVEAPGDP